MSEEPNIEPSNVDRKEGSTNAYLDKLTMELLLNKTHYSKYLERTDPKKHEEFREHKAKLRKYAIEIVDITSQLVENSKTVISADVEETFDAYVKSIFRFLELKELENPKEHETTQTDEDMLFGEIDEKPTTQSFWSKERVKKSNFTNMDVRTFSSGRK
jgi:hypothetical protein